MKLELQDFHGHEYADWWYEALAFEMVMDWLDRRYSHIRRHWCHLALTLGEQDFIRFSGLATTDHKERKCNSMPSAYEAMRLR